MWIDVKGPQMTQILEICADTSEVKVNHGWPGTDSGRNQNGATTEGTEYTEMK